MPNMFACFIYRDLIDICILCVTADEEPEKKELLGVNTGIVIKPVKPNPFVKIFSFFRKKCIFSFVMLAKELCMHLSKLLLIYRNLHSPTLCDAVL